MIPATGLPLLAPVRLIPLIGDPLADLLQPDLTVLVNLGYGSITNGWSSGPANVPTPFGLLPTNIKLSDVVTALVNGAVQGVANALNDVKSPQLFDTSGLSGLLAGLNTLGLTPSANPSLLQLVAAFAAFGNAGVPVSATSVGSVITGAASSLLGIGEGLAATVQALAVSLPQYDAQLFTSQLQAGHLLNAIGMPIAADLALAPYALIYGAAFPVITAVATTVTQLAELAGLEPNPAASRRQDRQHQHPGGYPEGRPRHRPGHPGYREGQPGHRPGHDSCPPDEPSNPKDHRDHHDNKSLGNTYQRVHVWDREQARTSGEHNNAARRLTPRQTQLILRTGNQIKGC